MMIPATQDGRVRPQLTSTATSPRVTIVAQGFSVAVDRVVEIKAPAISAGVTMGEANAALTETPSLQVKLQLEVSIHNLLQIVGLPRAIIAFRRVMLRFPSMGWMDVALQKAAKRCRKVQRLDIIWGGLLHFNKTLHSKAL